MNKLPAHIYLDEHDIPYERKSFPPETEKGAANVARVLGFAERQAVKTLIFQVDTGERVLVMLGGDQKYEAARDRYRPFDRLVDEDPPARAAIAARCVAAAAAQRPAYVVINNKAEGSAPLSAFQLAAVIAALGR